mmetsp:Transcript_30697/g.73073  ORF Transcript_30697/g.73073 Transcript_30697/m.73073 type:complete len:233 (+) Transcript_30697:4123-4821(+)
MLGTTSRAMGPSTSGSTGTSRHPRNSSSLSLQTFSMTSLTSFLRSSPWGRKTMPTPGLGQLSLRYSPNSSQGICVMIPAPSPEMSSPPHAPRCSMQSSAVRPCCRILWVPNSPPVVGLAMKPTPQASRSLTIGAGPSNMLDVSPGLRGKTLTCVARWRSSAAPLDDTEVPCLRDTCVWKAYAVANTADASISLILTVSQVRSANPPRRQEKVRIQGGSGSTLDRNKLSIDRV